MIRLMLNRILVNIHLSGIFIIRYITPDHYIKMQRDITSKIFIIKKYYKLKMHHLKHLINIVQRRRLYL